MVEFGKKSITEIHQHIELQRLFYLSKRNHHWSETFRHIEEQKWEIEKQHKKLRRDTHNNNNKNKIKNKTATEIEDEGFDIARQLLKKADELKTQQPSKIFDENIVDQLLQFSETYTTADETKVIPGIIGLTHPYLLDDAAFATYNKQIRPNVWTEKEDNLEQIQNRVRVRAMLEEAGLIPPVDSVLWDSDDMDDWRHWHETGELKDDTRIGWEGLNIDTTSSLMEDIIQKDLYPGTLTQEESDKAWARRKARTKEFQKRITVDRDEFPVEFVTRTYWEPRTASEKMRRYRERKAILRVHIPFLNLPQHAKKRFRELVGKRIVKGQWAQIVADRYHTKEENKLYCLMIMRSLVSEAFKAEPSFVQVGEDIEEVRKRHTDDLQKRIEEALANGKYSTFRFNFAE